MNRNRLGIPLETIWRRSSEEPGDICERSKLNPALSVSPAFRKEVEVGERQPSFEGFHLLRPYTHTI